MPSTREVRNRIKSLEGTKKITKAMKMVAAAKVKRAQERVTSTRPYARKLQETFQYVAQKLAQEDIQEPLLDKRPVETVGYVIVSSDKGMCGGYNSNMFRFALKQIMADEGNNVKVKAWLVGNKAIGFFRHSDFEIMGRFSQLPVIPTYSEAEMIREAVVDAFLTHKVDRVVLLYTEFVSMIKYKPTALQLFPIEPPHAEDPLKASYVYEPGPAELLQEVLPRYVDSQIYRALLEAAASQLAARMTAMDAATNNAQDLLVSMTLVYNKVRQAYITKEILEVIGGSEALNN